MSRTILIGATTGLAALGGGLMAKQPPSLPLTVGGTNTRVVWSQIVSTDGDDWVNDLVALRNGNILAVGFLNRADAAFGGDWYALAAEMNLQGQMLSDHRYGTNGGTDAFWSAAETGNGNRIFAGFTTRVGPGGINGYSLVARPDGSIAKENGFGHAGYDRFTDLVPVAGGFLYVGHSQLPEEGAPRRTYIVKTDEAGLYQWERIYGGPEMWSALYIEPAGNGDFVIAGGTDGGGDNDMFVMRVNADGRELWRKRVGTPDWDEINHGVVVRPDGRIVLVGYTHARGAETNDIVAATLTRDGTIERLERFGGVGDDRAINGRSDADGLVWIVGQTASAGEGGSDLLLTAYHPDRGFAGSAMTLGGAAHDNGTVVHPVDGGLVIAGYSRNLGTASQDAFVARIDRPQTTRRHPAFSRTVVKPAR